MIAMPMHSDDEVCCCFHVPLRKIENFCRNTRPMHASQISECLSAGTGCGWCVPLLKRIHARVCRTETPWWRALDETVPPGTSSAADYDSPEAYAAARQAYIVNMKKSDRP